METKHSPLCEQSERPICSHCKLHRVQSSRGRFLRLCDKCQKSGLKLPPANYARLSEGLKGCTSCKAFKPLSEFHKCATTKTGLKPKCKDCVCAYSRAYHAQNKEVCRAKNREFYYSRKADPELHAALLAHRREVVSRWREKNRQRVSSHITQWRRENPERHKAIMHRRNAHKRGNEGSFTAEEWQELCVLCDFRCLACGKKRKLTADHITPLSKGGTSYIDNIQPLCGPCNSSKGGKSVDYR